MERWAELLADREYRRVAEDTVGDAWVSTVWLGLDHSFLGGPPLTFETMIWSVEGDKILDGPIRYATESAAIEGHRYIVAELRRRNELYGGPI